MSALAMGGAVFGQGEALQEQDEGVEAGEGLARGGAELSRYLPDGLVVLYFSEHLQHQMLPPKWDPTVPLFVLLLALLQSLHGHVPLPVIPRPLPQPDMLHHLESDSFPGHHLPKRPLASLPAIIHPVYASLHGHGAARHAFLF